MRSPSDYVGQQNVEETAVRKSSRKRGKANFQHLPKNVEEVKCGHKKVTIEIHQRENGKAGRKV